MRLRDHYDWIVLGNNPGALLSASLVSRLGLSVLILPMAPNLGLSVSKSGHYFDPEPNYLLGLGRSGTHSGLIFECLSHLGVPTPEIEYIGTGSSQPQVLTPRSRFVLARKEDLSYELQREFGHEVAQRFGLDGALKRTELEYLNFWENLPKRLTLSTEKSSASAEPLTLKDLRRKLKNKLHRSDLKVVPWINSNHTLSEWVSTIGASDLEDVCTGLWYAVTSSTHSNPALFELLHILSLSRTGASFRGGMTAYRKFLLTLARRLGVHVAAEIDCRRIFVEEGRFAGVQITGRGNMVSTRGGILGCSFDKAYNRVTFTGRIWFHKKKKSPVPIGWRFTLSIMIQRDIVMPKMLPRAVWQEKDAPILEIELTNPSDYGAHDPNYQILHLRTLMPFSMESLKLDYQKIVAGRMVRQAMEIIPFLETVILHIYPDFRNRVDKSELQNGNELETLYGFRTLQEIPDNLLVFAGKGLGSNTGIEGLFIASEESYPELGSFGPAVAATESVAWLAHRSGIAGPLV
ncbi:MAG: hypothetical protein ABIQ95_11405 [Bdellovibrionia bacterium]